MQTANFIIIFIGIIIIIGAFGIVISIVNLINSFRAERNLIKLLKKDPETSKKIKEAYEQAIKNHQYEKFDEIEVVLKNEASRLNKASEQRSIIDALDNNTEEGRNRYISNIASGTISGMQTK